MSAKTDFRKAIRSEIRMLPQAYLKATDAAIAERFLQLSEFKNAKRIFAYLSVGREVDTKQIITHAIENGKEVFLPVVLGDGIMEFAQFESLGSLLAGSLHIPEPDVSAVRAIPCADDLIIVPGLCFDNDKYRMGQGGGYYDRYLAKHSAISVGVAREQLMPNAVPRETHDLPVDLLITETRTIR